MDYKISIIGLGFVGSAMYASFEKKGLKPNKNLFGFDKYKNGGIGSLSECLNTDIMFLCLPTQYNSSIGEYDKSNIFEVISQNFFIIRFI